MVMPAVVHALGGRLADEWWHLSEVLMAPHALGAAGAQVGGKEGHRLQD